MRQLQLDILTTGLPGITKKRGGNWYEAIVLALNLNHHQSGVILSLNKEVVEKIQLIWEEIIEKDAKLGWNDLTELAEEAATGLALLLIQELTEYKVLWRARKGSKIDYFLSKKIIDRVMMPEALLEISGLFRETKNNRVSSRVGVKIKQAKQSPFNFLPSYVVVIELSIPKGKFIKL